MSDEGSLWSTLSSKLRPFGLLHRVENSVESGMPDVHYLLRRNPRAAAVPGWLELKYEARWPVGPSTPVVLSTLTLEQVTWHEDYARLGGRVSTLLQIGASYMLLHTPLLRAVYDRRVLRSAMMDWAPVYASRTLPLPEIIKCLTA